MTRAEKMGEAKRLRESGLTLDRIADRLGVSRSTVLRWTDPAFAERARAECRAYKDRNREAVRAQGREHKRTLKVECPQCGGTMWPVSKRCEACGADEVDSRARQIERWWAEGWPLRRIADKLGWTQGHLGREMARLREKDYHLPYRRQPSKPKHPELAA